MHLRIGYELIYSFPQPTPIIPIVDVHDSRGCRTGRAPMARGRDASDVAIATTFGPHTLESFRVWKDQIPGTAD